MQSMLDYYWPNADKPDAQRYFAHIDEDFAHMWDLMRLLNRVHVITDLDACRISIALQTVAVTYRTSSSSL